MSLIRLDSGVARLACYVTAAVSARRGRQTRRKRERERKGESVGSSGLLVPSLVD